MERKIGEIFEFGGEWYQCLEEKTCTCFGCDFRHHNCDDINLRKIKGNCQSGHRSDKTSVIFKKLEKVGKLYEHYGKLYQCYKLPMEIEIRLLPNNCNPIGKDNLVEIEIKQNKEDMEENKLNLKPFNIQKAREGKPVCTRDGRKARIVCFDVKGDICPIIALVEKDNFEVTYRYNENGQNAYSKSELDLMMLPEKREGWVNVYRDCDGANITKDDNIYSSKDAAIASAQIIDGDNYIATTIIKWEE